MLSTRFSASMLQWAGYGYGWILIYGSDVCVVVAFVRVDDIRRKQSVRGKERHLFLFNIQK